MNFACFSGFCSYNQRHCLYLTKRSYLPRLCLMLFVIYILQTLRLLLLLLLMMMMMMMIDDDGYCFLCSLCLTNRALMLLVWCQEGHPVCKTYHCSKKKPTYFLRETCRGPSHIHVGMENRSVKEKLSSSRTDSKTLHREREG